MNWYLRAFIILVLFIAAIGFWQSRSQKTKPLVPGKQPIEMKVILPDTNTAILPALVAEKKGIYKKHNLAVKQEVINNFSPQMLVSQKGDVGLGGINPFIAAAIEGANVKWVGTYFPNYPYVLVSGVEPAQIKTLGLNILGGNLHVVALRILQNTGVKSESVTLIVSGEAKDRLAAMEKGELDATVISIGTWTEYKTTAGKDSKIKEYYNAYQAKGNDFPLGVVVRGDYLDGNRNALKAYTQALLEAGDYIVAHPKEASEILVLAKSLSGKEADVEVELFRKGFKNVNPVPQKEVAQFGLQVIRGVNKSEKAANYNIDNFVDTNLAKEIK